jgi:hypothetical protein
VLRFCLAAMSVLLLLLAGACGDGGTEPGAITPFVSGNESPEAPVTPVTPVPKPESVSEGAQAITQTTNLGRIVRRAGQDPQAVMTRQLDGATCSDGIVTLDTSGETIFALLLTRDCSAFWDDETTALFVGRQASFSLQATESRFRIFIETLEGAQAEFTALGIWVE